MLAYDIAIQVFHTMADRAEAFMQGIAQRGFTRRAQTCKPDDQTVSSLTHILICARLSDRT